MYRRLILMVIWAGLLPVSAFGGWGENIRLTYRGDEINPQVIARNDTVHVAWDQLYGNVSYIRSIDGGETWDPIVDLTETGHTGSYSNLNLDENGLLVSWLDDDHDLDITKIGVATSPDGGFWNQNRYVATDNPSRFGLPASAVKGDSIFLVYFSHRDDSTGNRPLRAMHSYDYGQTWNDEVTVGYPLVSPEQPIRICYCCGTLLSAWASAPDSNHLNQWHVIGSRSTDAGQTWSGIIWISPQRPDWAFDPRLKCNQWSGQFAAGWTDFRNFQYAFHGDVFAAISSDCGQSWPLETRASSVPTTLFLGIDYFADTLLAVWSDMRFYDEGLHEIIINRSNDAGIFWQDEERITNTPDESYVPWVSYDVGNINVVWREHPPGSGTDIFFKKFTPDVTGADENFHILPEAISIAAYPNPFNSNLQISVSANQAGKIVFYDVQGRLVNELDYPSGTSRIIWEGRDNEGRSVSSGTYFMEAKGGNLKKRIKVVYLK